VSSAILVSLLRSRTVGFCRNEKTHLIGSSVGGLLILGYSKLVSFSVYPTLQKACKCARMGHMHIHIERIWMAEDFITDTTLIVVASYVKH
jgi:hypothetical protein